MIQTFTIRAYSFDTKYIAVKHIRCLTEQDALESFCDEYAYQIANGLLDVTTISISI